MLERRIFSARVRKHIRGVGASVRHSGTHKELLLRALWQVIWSTKGYSRLYQEWGNHFHHHKSILAGKDYKCNKRGGWGEMLSVPIKEDSDCVVIVLHKILQVTRKAKNWAKRWVRSNTLYFLLETGNVCEAKHCWILVWFKPLYKQQLLATVAHRTQQAGPVL